MNDKGEVIHKFAPFSVGERIYVRKQESTLDWKSYRFEMVMSDGTRNDFVFTAKDDGDAQRKVRERIAATQHAEGTYKLLRLEAPKELDLGALGPGTKTVAESDEKETKAEAKESKGDAKRKPGRPSKADKEAEERAKANAADAEAEKPDSDEK